MLSMSRDQSALCRNIQDITTQATSVNKALKISLSADYTFSRMLTLNAYYDHQTNIPVVSASSYPTSTHDFGVSLKFSLTRWFGQGNSCLRDDLLLKGMK